MHPKKRAGRGLVQHPIQTPITAIASLVVVVLALGTAFYSVIVSYTRQQQ